jgi:hypothetical protein
MIPYGRHSINDDDVAAVVQALKSDWLTTGPLVEAFELGLEKVLVPRHFIAPMLQLILVQEMKSLLHQLLSLLHKQRQRYLAQPLFLPMFYQVRPILIHRQ